ncbi:class I SAM-dependent methyltransferase [Streptomyces acidiscabies]|uniref:class I SAM-dependent methyltransferase n=1 Tax=Streptomyces acidiscabies TaxID=42234 RepID=UPI00073F427B|nr:class I SAM-dependent methyltransferase [Streptomyces acidiscabies]GAQ58817.1 ubiquinone/menaquinone biosynthesis methyltransferase [Streptomyces acidiscabies]GAV45789.1 ubiquinone/menaquinone biosynthesis methyltransferase [Streptomyces acidiscabies]
MPDASFRPDLYRGTAGYYDCFRLAYPDTMLTDLIRRTSPSGHGRLLDLACGTGQLAFPLRAGFAEVWAVDAEADMGEVVRAKVEAGGDVADVEVGAVGAASSGDAAFVRAVTAKAAVTGDAVDARGVGAVASGDVVDAGEASRGGAARVRVVTAKAEELDMDAGSVELVVIGNAFHRLPRDLVARRALTWLEPGGHLALCWSTSPWAGPLDWQRAFGDVLRRWQEALGAASRVPPGAEQRRQTDPDREVLSRAGFEPAVRHEFAVEHRWTVEELAGHVRSTSFLPPSVLADRATEFDGDLMTVLSPYATDGHLTETVSFAYDLARKPGRTAG